MPKKYDHHQKSSCSSPARLRQIEDKEIYERGDVIGKNSSKKNATPLRSEYSLGLVVYWTREVTFSYSSFDEWGHNWFHSSHRVLGKINYLRKNYMVWRSQSYNLWLFDLSNSIYIFRSKENPQIEKINLWYFTKKQDSCKLKEKPGNCDTETDSNSEDESNSARIIRKYSTDHPQHDTEGHRERMDACWPKYLAKRLPDLKRIEERNDLLPKERQKRREE